MCDTTASKLVKSIQIPGTLELVNDIERCKVRDTRDTQDTQDTRDTHGTRDTQDT